MAPPTCDPGASRHSRPSLARSAAVVLIVSAVVFAVNATPYLYASLSAPPDRVYTGLLFDIPDHAQYWSWVTASDAGLFISNTMTPEANPPVFANPMMWLLARIRAAFGLSFPALFQVWRAGATLLLVAALLAFVRAIVPDRDRRRTALAVALVGSGFGWLLVVVKVTFGLADVPYPLDIYVVEPNTFFGLLAYPHLVLAQALLLSTLLGGWLAYRGHGWRALVLSGSAALGLAATHAYDLLTVYLVLFGFGLSAWIRHRRVPWALVRAGAVIGVGSAPVALYYQNLTAHDPLWRAVLAQYANAGVWTPPHVHLVVLMGLPLVLAVVRLVTPGSRDDRLWFVGTWACLGAALVYLPVAFQIKFLGGWQFPLAVLAAHAWHDRVLPWLGRTWRWRPMARLSTPALGTALLILLVVPTNLYLFAWRFVELRRHSAPYYLHQDEMTALEWLASQTTPHDVAMAPEIVGQFVPNYGRTRAYLAHWAMTNRYHERVANVRRFFDPATPDAWRTSWLRDEGVTLVLRAGSVPGLDRLWDPAETTWLEPVLVLPRAQLYRFRSTAGE